MAPADLEQIYERLAQQIDAVGEDMSELYLAKLALLLARQFGDVTIALQCIEDAAQSLDGSSPQSGAPLNL